ncbi:hypothetical protein BC834DRAFT_847570 [Gloeopeniophorella convolvens]|nr:hypothetical protein BC834DRAFT_847570 [Gloeopeniophorella convolvens]
MSFSKASFLALSTDTHSLDSPSLGSGSSGSPADSFSELLATPLDLENYHQLRLGNSLGTNLLSGSVLLHVPTPRHMQPLVSLLGHLLISTLSEQPLAQRLSRPFKALKNSSLRQVSGYLWAIYAHSDNEIEDARHILQHATHEDLMGAGNEAHRDLFSKYLESAASLKVLQGAHDKLIEKVGTPSTQASADVLPAPPIITLDKNKYENVKYWHKGDELNARKPHKQNKFPTADDAPRGPGQSAEGENVTFWFFQESNGNMVSCDVVREFRKSAKDIWMRWARAGYVQSPWNSVDEKYKKQFYALMEDEFPFLRLCARHYECDAIAHIDYSHWYKNNVKAKQKNERAQSLVPAKRTRSPTPIGNTNDPAVANTSEPQTPAPDPACPPAIARVRPRIVIDQTTPTVPATLPQEPTRREQTKTATQPSPLAIVAHRVPPPSVLQPEDRVAAPVPAQHRNLYATWYIKTYGPQPCDKVAKAWNELDKATLEEWKQISADAKKSNNATT